MRAHFLLAALAIIGTYANGSAEPKCDPAEPHSCFECFECNSDAQCVPIAGCEVHCASNDDCQGTMMCESGICKSCM